MNGYRTFKLSTLEIQLTWCTPTNIEKCILIQYIISKNFYESHKSGLAKLLR